MPELPEVETVRLALRPHLTGCRVLDVEVRQTALRIPVSATALHEACVQRRIEDVRRRGKYIIIELEDASAILCHLGMTGAFRITDRDCAVERHEHVVWTLDSRKSLRFVDPRRFGMVVAVALPGPGKAPDILSHLGPEPLGADFNPAYLADALRDRKTPVKNLLLDQTIVAGLGNIYVSEALYRAGVSPRRHGGNIGNIRCSRIVASVRAVLQDALACGGTTIRDFRTLDGSEGKFAQCLDVYGRHGKACARCGSAIRRILQAGRSTFYCPKCQR